MFNHLFAVMHEAVDDLLARYPLAEGGKKQRMEEQVKVLTEMSGSFVDEWVKLEEKLARLRSLASDSAQQSGEWKGAPAEVSLSGQEQEIFEKGQGYYTLLMYEQAIRHFEDIVARQPEFLLARLYLGMGYLRTGKDEEAFRHFLFLLPLAEDGNLKAILYNALACLHAKRSNLQQAEEYFKLACQSNPARAFPQDS